MPFSSANGRALACAQLDPLVRSHLLIAALALQAAGLDTEERQIVGHAHPAALEALVRERLGGHAGRFLNSYLGALTPAQRAILAQAAARLSGELVS